MAQAMHTGVRRNRREHLRQSANARDADALEDLGAMGKDVSRFAGESASYVSERVREYPATAVGLSVAAGLLLGMLFARR